MHFIPDLKMRWRNTQELAEGGCTTSVGVDSLLFDRPGIAWEFLRQNHTVPDHFERGNGTIVAITAFVELGLPPSQPIVAATRNGAMARLEQMLDGLASNALDQYGTVDPSKFVDLLVLALDRSPTSVTSTRFKW